MSIRNTALLAALLALLVSGCPRPPAQTGVEDGSGAEPAGPASEHASLAAYPGAVVTAEDQDSNTTVTVEADGRTVTARDAQGQELLRVDMLEKCGTPAVGNPVVRNVSLEQGKIHVVMGKHTFAVIDLESKSVECTGSD